jgi:predicted TIM-barrel fold metal-dependent hydrolase
MRIWDLHCHFPQAGLSPENRIERTLRVADRMGIERLCLYMGYPMVQDPTPEIMRTQNDMVLSVLPNHPDRLLGFVYLNPKHTAESLAELDRCVKNGPMVGVKLWVAQHCNAPELDAIVQRAHELKAVIFQHTWFKVMENYPGESTPTDLAELAQRHPNINLICGHTGGDWERGIREIAPVKNTFSDLAGSDPVNGYTEMAVRELGEDRIIYGSDTPGRSFASQLAKVSGADISDEAKQKIFSGNLIRLLTPILKGKGIKF